MAEQKLQNFSSPSILVGGKSKIYTLGNFFESFDEAERKIWLFCETQKAKKNHIKSENLSM